MINLQFCARPKTSLKRCYSTISTSTIFEKGASRANFSRALATVSISMVLISIFSAPAKVQFYPG